MHGWLWGYGMPGFTYHWNVIGGSWWGRGFMIGLLVLGVALVVILARYLSHRGREHSRPSEALEILRRRYAGGEIDEETFKRMKQDLS